MCVLIRFIAVPFIFMLFVFVTHCCALQPICLGNGHWCWVNYNRTWKLIRYKWKPSSGNENKFFYLCLALLYGLGLPMQQIDDPRPARQGFFWWWAAWHKLNGGKALVGIEPFRYITYLTIYHYAIQRLISLFAMN